MSSIDEWLALHGGMVGADVYPIDSDDIDAGPQELRAWTNFTNASSDPRARAIGSYVQRINIRLQSHILNMACDIDTAEVTGLTPGSVRKMGPGVIPGTLEQFDNAIEALTAARDRIYPNGEV